MAWHLLREHGASIYMPTFVETISMGLIVPVLPLYCRKLGADDTLIGVVVSMHGLGALCTGAIAGAIIGRVGERTGMLGGTSMRLTAVSTADRTRTFIKCSFARAAP